MKMPARILIILFLFFLFPVQPAKAFQWVDREDWAGIYFQGKKLGFSHSKLEVTENELIVSSRIFFRLQVGGVNQVTSFSQESILNKELHLKSFSLLQEIMGHRQKVEGHVEKGKLFYEVTTLGYGKKYSKPFLPGYSLSSTSFMNILQKGLEVGKRGKFNLFVEPFQIIKPLEYNILRTEKMKVNGKTETVYIINQKYVGTQSNLWVTRDGTIMRELAQNGMETLRESAEEAQKLGGESVSVSSFITLSLVKTRRPIDDPENKRVLKIKMSNLVSEDIVPEDHRQTALETKKVGKGFSTILKVESEPRKPSSRMKIPVTAKVDKAYLEETAEIQIGHPMIKALSRDLVEGQKDAWKAAKIINQWVFDNMEKVLVDSFTALHALHERRGECQSHTNLFTALARAAGIPTKVVNGLVYSSEFKGFVYHAWPEVFVGEWRALDPTFGQDLVDATHIKLSEGGYEGTVKLMDFIGKVRIDIL